MQFFINTTELLALFNLYKSFSNCLIIILSYVFKLFINEEKRITLVIFINKIKIK